MKLTFPLTLISLLLSCFIWTGMTCANNNKTTYLSISTVETSVLAANAAYLDQVVTGKVTTNNVPKVEAAFNDTQLALHAAASLASGGDSAPIPSATLAKATDFTNVINSATSK